MSQNRQRHYQAWSAQVTLGTGDTTKTLFAAISGKSIVVTGLYGTVVTSAVQAITIDIGTVRVKSLPASLAAGSQFSLGPLEHGLIGQSGSGLIITPAAAGPSIHVVAEGYILPS